MNHKILKCPNIECSSNRYSNYAIPFRYTKKGYAKTKAKKQQKYKCKICGKNFSRQTFKSTYRQKKPDINQKVFQLLCSGVSQRRTAKILGVNVKTVVRKFLWLADLAQKEHDSFIANSTNMSSHVLFDEMETYEHTKLKPLSIALAVDQRSKHILDAQVARMPAKGKIAKLSVLKYGYRKDCRRDARRKAIQTIASIAKRNIIISCDENPSYPRQIWDQLSRAVIKQYKSRKSPKLLDIAEDGLSSHEEIEAITRKSFDPLFQLNHICAKLRADLARLIRRTWSNTKVPSRLQAHLNLYLAWHNNYQIT